MQWFESLWNGLLPAPDDVILRGQAGLLIVTALGLTAGLLALIVTWAISRDLERMTVAGSLIFVGVLAGISSLARAGQVMLAAWLLVGLLTLLITINATRYGVRSLMATAYPLPIALAAHSLGPGAGFGIALWGALVVWLLAWGETAGWYRPPYAPHISHLTFNAPTLTVLFLLLALITSYG